VSRSRKKTPIGGIAKADSDKPYKKLHSRKERRIVGDKLKRVARDGIDPEADDVVDLEHTQVRYSSWDAPKDGKSYWDDPKAYRK
jgi:hypothetical protein